jgi:hypothetical protein
VFQVAARTALAGGRAGSIEANLWLNAWVQSLRGQGKTEAQIRQYGQELGVDDDAQAIRRVERLYAIEDAGHIPPRFTGSRGLASGIREDCKRHSLILPPIATYPAKDDDLLMDLVRALWALENLIRAVTRDPGMRR